MPTEFRATCRPKAFGDNDQREFLMRLQYFGDSYDIVKRGFLQWLAPLGQWYIQPLFTDDASPQQAADFARFLGAHLVEPFLARTTKERQAALDACNGTGNLLIDPDIGVVLPQPGKAVKRTHISAASLQALCTSNPGRVIMIFDQALRRESPEDSLRSKIAWFSERKIAAIAFRSHASFIFCSSSTDHLADVARLLKKAGLPASRLVGIRRAS